MSRSLSGVQNAVFEDLEITGSLKVDGITTIDSLTLEGAIETTSLSASSYVVAPIVEAGHLLASVGLSGPIVSTRKLEGVILSGVQSMVTCLNCDLTDSSNTLPTVSFPSVTALDWNNVPTEASASVGDLCQDGDGFLKIKQS